MLYVHTKPTPPHRKTVVSKPTAALFTHKQRSSVISYVIKTSENWVKSREKGHGGALTGKVTVIGVYRVVAALAAERSIQQSTNIIEWIVSHRNHARAYRRKPTAWRFSNKARRSRATGTSTAHGNPRILTSLSHSCTFCGQGCRCGPRRTQGGRGETSRLQERGLTGPSSRLVDSKRERKRRVNIQGEEGGKGEDGRLTKRPREERV